MHYRDGFEVDQDLAHSLLRSDKIQREQVFPNTTRERTASDNVEKVSLLSVPPEERDVK